MNIKDYLVSQDIDYTLYKLSTTSVSDILIADRSITQSLVQEFHQYIGEKGEFYEKQKDIYSFPKSHRFLKNDLELGHHVLRGIDPGSYLFDDCVTCDGHGSIGCSSCSGKGEIVCPTCLGKTYITNTIKKPVEKVVTCDSCNGSKNIQYKCKSCTNGQIYSSEVCRTCFGKGQLLNPQTNTWSSCQQCSGKGKIMSQKVCGYCNGSGILSAECTKCHGKGTLTVTDYVAEIVNSPCTNCKQTGRITCPTCRGRQEVTCPTCNGERKTHQFTMNIFTVDIKEKWVLLNTTLDQQAINTIGSTKHQKVTTMTPQDKDKLISYSSLNSIKITPELLQQVKGTLYTLESIKNSERYYLWSTDGVVYITLGNIPKNNLQEMFMGIIRPLKQFFLKVYEKIIRPIYKLLNGKKEY